MKKRIKARPVMILASIGILGIAYTPNKPIDRPSKSFIEATYVRGTGLERWQASETRKEQLLSDVRAARRAIRLFAESYYVDRNTKITGYTSAEKTIIHSRKLIDKIIEVKFG